MNLSASRADKAKKVLRRLYAGYALLCGVKNRGHNGIVIVNLERSDWNGERFSYSQMYQITKAVFDDLLLGGLIIQKSPPRFAKEANESAWYSLSQKGLDFLFPNGKGKHHPSHGEYGEATLIDGSRVNIFFDNIIDRWWVQGDPKVSLELFNPVSTLENDYPFFVTPGYFACEMFVYRLLFDLAVRRYRKKDDRPLDVLSQVIDCSQSTNEYQAEYDAHFTTSGKPMIQIYEDKNGTAINTDAADEREFVQGIARLLYESIVTANPDEDWSNRLELLIPQIIDIACKYRGYKNNVNEKRVLTIGQVLTGTPIAETGNREQLILSAFNGNGSH